MKYIIATFAMLMAFSCPAQEKQEGTDSHSHAASVVRITLNFTEREKEVLGYDGKAATGWFCGNSKYLITIEHVVKEPDISRNDWTALELSYCSRLDSDFRYRKEVLVRLADMIECPGEDIAVLELKTPLSDVVPLAVRSDELRKDSKTSCTAYKNGELVSASGTYHGIARAEDHLSADHVGSGLFEMQHGTDRLALDHGSSGAPVLDENGEVVAVLSTVITQTLHFPLTEPMRISTSWGTPNQFATIVPRQLILLGGKRK